MLNKTEVDFVKFEVAVRRPISRPRRINRFSEFASLKIRPEPALVSIDLNAGQKPATTYLISLVAFTIAGVYLVNQRNVMRIHYLKISEIAPGL